MVGGESRKSRKPFSVTEPNDPTNFRRASSRDGFETTRQNTNLKYLTSYIVRTVSNKLSSEGKRAMVSSSRRNTSSENTGDVIVEIISIRTVWRTPGVDTKLVVQPPTCRDRRTLRRDRSNPGNDRVWNPVYHQFEIIYRFH